MQSSQQPDSRLPATEAKCAHKVPRVLVGTCGQQRLHAVGAALRRRVVQRCVATLHACMRMHTASMATDVKEMQMTEPEMRCGHMLLWHVPLTPSRPVPMPVGPGDGANVLVVHAASSMSTGDHACSEVQAGQHH